MLTFTAKVRRVPFARLETCADSAALCPLVAELARVDRLGLVCVASDTYRGVGYGFGTTAENFCKKTAHNRM